MYICMMLLGYFIVVIAVCIPTDNLHIPTNNLHIHKKIIGGYVDSLQWGESNFIMNVFTDNIDQRYCIAFYRQQPCNKSINPLLKIRAYFFLNSFPFEQIKVFLLNKINIYIMIC